MRLWVHVIWLKTNPGVTLMTCGPREDKKLEALIQKWDEQTVAYAWWLYVNSDPPAYHLAPVKHVHQYSYNGQPRMREAEDEGAITRFPLSAFLAVSEGFEVQAAMHKEMFEKSLKQFCAEKGKTDGFSREEKSEFWFRAGGATGSLMQEAFTVVWDAVKVRSAEIKPKWGNADREVDEF